MKITDALYGEHGLFYVQMGYLDSVLGESGELSLDALKALTDGFERMVVSHAAIEEEGLFAALDASLGGMGPLEVMRGEHREIDRLLAAARDADTVGVCASCLRDLLTLLRQHFTKEERVLFVLAQQHLDEDTLNTLGDTWAETRAVAVRGPEDAPGCH
ncbi:MAG: hemerythrin domain-containing protein [Rhodospirillales bacterium]|nr:hemerythrin domain-containing protein [Alphaproteobacteria bacterium]MBL6947091.1 hemerythrin domain-containing protein [Rhodospirillales bacterium]